MDCGVLVTVRMRAALIPTQLLLLLVGVAGSISYSFQLDKSNGDHVIEA